MADSSKKDSSNQDKSAYKLVRPGDIAYNKMRAWQGAIGVSEYRGNRQSCLRRAASARGSSTRVIFHHLFANTGFREGGRALVVRHHVRYVESPA